MQPLKKSNRKLAIIISSSILLAVAIVLSSIGIYLKLNVKEKPTVVTNPLDFSVDAWDGSSSGNDFNENYAGRGLFTKTINSAASFIHFVQEVNSGIDFKNYTIYLNSNIDFKGQTIPTIGNAENKFKGAFDGGCYTLMNAEVDGNGLFANTQNATIKNLGLYNFTFKTDADAIQSGVGAMIDSAIDTSIENCFVRLGNGILVNRLHAQTKKLQIINSFVDSSADGLIGTLNTSNTSAREVTISNCYFTNGESAVTEEIGTVYKFVENVIKPNNKSDFSSWRYAKDYSEENDWCDYAYHKDAKEMDFVYPIQKGFVKVYLTGSYIESVMNIGNEVVETSNLVEAFNHADEVKEAEINLLVEKIFMEARAEVNDATVKVNAPKDTVIIRGENNLDSMFVGSGNSKIILGGKQATANSTVSTFSTVSEDEQQDEKNVDMPTIIIDGNRDVVEKNNLESGALVVSCGGEIEINENVILKNNVNNNVKYGGAVLAYDMDVKPVINGLVENCYAEYGGGAVAVIGIIPEELPSAKNCSTKGKGGAIYIGETFEEASSISAIKELYGKGLSAQPMEEIYHEAVYIKDKTYTIPSSAAAFGGAIYSHYSFKLSGCSFDGQGLENTSADGGAVYTDSDVYISGCSFKDCASGGEGGAVYAAGNVYAEATKEDTYKTYTNGKNFNTGHYINWDNDFSIETKFTVTQLNKRYLVFGTYQETGVSMGLNIEINTSNYFRVYPMKDNSTVEETIITSARISANDEVYVSFTWDSSANSWTLSAYNIFSGSTFYLFNQTKEITKFTMSGSSSHPIVIGAKDYRTSTTTFSSIKTDGIEVWEYISENNSKETVYREAAAFVNNCSSISGGAIFASGKVEISGDVIFSGNSVYCQNSTSGYGGAIYSSSVILRGAVGFYNNSCDDGGTAGYGGAIYTTSVRIYGNAIFSGHSQSVSSSKGVIYAQNASIYGDATFRSNSSVGIYVTNNLSIYGNPSFINNSHRSIYSTGATIEIDGNPIFSYNTAVQIYSDRSSGSVTITIDGNPTFSNNSTGSGIININDAGDTVVINGSPTFKNNTASNNCAGIYSSWYAYLTINGNPTFSNNTSKSGGLIYACETTINGDPTFSNNATTNGSGGVFYSSSWVITINGNPTFTNNTASGKGGVIYANSSSKTVKITGNPIFSGNSASGSKAYGGAIYAPNVNISGNPIFRDNKAVASTTTSVYAAAGGAIWGQYVTIETGAKPQFINNTTTWGNGGAIFARYEVHVGGGDFYSNHGNLGTKTHSGAVQGGAIYTRDNSETAIVDAKQSILTINGATRFVDNEADTGGAIYGFNITINAPTSFIHNRSGSYSYGGAIYAYKLLDIEAEVTFKNNVNRNGTSASGDVYQVAGGEYRINATVIQLSDSAIHQATFQITGDGKMTTDIELRGIISCYVASPSAGKVIMEYDGNTYQSIPLKIECVNSNYYASDTGGKYSLVSGSTSYSDNITISERNPVVAVGARKTITITTNFAGKFRFSSDSGTTLGTHYGVTASGISSVQNATEYTLPSTKELKVTWYASSTAKTHKINIRFYSSASARYIMEEINITVKNLEITFNPNGGTVNPSKLTVSSADSNIYTGYDDLALPTPTRTGYTFDGWYTKNIFNIAAAPGIQDQYVANGATFVGDVTLTTYMNKQCLYMGATSMYDSTAKKYYYFPVSAKAKTQYTLSYKAKLGSTTSYNGANATTSTNGLGVRYSDGSADATYLKNQKDSWQEFVLVTDPGKTIVGIYVSYNYSIIGYYTDIQLEMGTEATPYEAYYDGNLNSVTPDNDSIQLNLYDHTLIAGWTANTISCVYLHDEYRSYYYKTGTQYFATIGVDGGVGPYKYTINDTNAFELSYVGVTTSNSVGISINTNMAPGVYYYTLTVTDVGTGNTATWSDSQSVQLPGIQFYNYDGTEGFHYYMWNGAAEHGGIAWDSTYHFPLTDISPSVNLVVGYNFVGWATSDGTLVINSDGTLEKEVDGYTDEFGLWNITSENNKLYEVWERVLIEVVAYGDCGGIEIIHDAIVVQEDGEVLIHTSIDDEVRFGAGIGDKIIVSFSTIDGYLPFAWSWSTDADLYDWVEAGEVDDVDDGVLTCTLRITETFFERGVTYLGLYAVAGGTQTVHAYVNFGQEISDDSYAGVRMIYYDDEYVPSISYFNAYDDIPSISIRVPAGYEFMGLYVKEKPTVDSYKLENNVYRTVDECEVSTDEYGNKIYGTWISFGDSNPLGGRCGCKDVYALILAKTTPYINDINVGYELGEGLFGDTITFGNPTKTGATFVKWSISSKASIVVNGNSSTYTYGDYDSNCFVTPIWTPTHYTVTWLNADNTVLKEEVLLYGAVPTYSGATPTLPATGNIEYTFVGWTDKNGVTVSVIETLITENQVYVATYTESYLIVKYSTKEISVRLGEPLSVDISAIIGQISITLNSENSNVVGIKQSPITIEGGHIVNLADYAHSLSVGTTRIACSTQLVGTTVTNLTYIEIEVLDRLPCTIEVDKTEISMKYAETAIFSYSASVDGRFNITLSDNNLGTITYKENVFANKSHTANVTATAVGTLYIYVNFVPAEAHYETPIRKIITVTIEKNKLKTPTSARFEDNGSGAVSLLKWDDVATPLMSVYQYGVVVLKNGEILNLYSTTENEMDIESIIRNSGTGIYSAYIIAYSNNLDYYDNSDTTDIIGYAGALEIQVSGENATATIMGETSRVVIIGETASLEAELDNGCVFDHWEVTGDCKDAVSIANINSATTTLVLDGGVDFSGKVYIKAVAKKQEWHVLVSVNDVSFGTVNSADYVSFNQPYDSEISVHGNRLRVGLEEVVATPSASSEQYYYEFVGWEGIDGVTTLTRDMNIYARFERRTQSFTINIQTENAAYGTIDGQQRIEIVAKYGTGVLFIGNTIIVGDNEFVARANNKTAQYSFNFVRWEGEIKEVQGESTITAVFEAIVNKYTITIKSNNDDYGTVSSTSMVVDYGTSIITNGAKLVIAETEITATPKSGTLAETYTFVGWTGTSLSVSGDMIITANFEKQLREYAITIVSNNSNYGTVTVASIGAALGEVIRVQDNTLSIGSGVVAAIPTENSPEYVYSFVDFTYNSEDVNGKTVNGVMTITANFKRETREYVVEVLAGEGGYVCGVEGDPTSVLLLFMPYGTGIIVNGDTIEIGGTVITVISTEGYAFKSWAGTVGNSTVQNNVDIVARFEKTYMVKLYVEGTLGAVTNETTYYVFANDLFDVESRNVYYIGSEMYYIDESYISWAMNVDVYWEGVEVDTDDEPILMCSTEPQNGQYYVIRINIS